MQEYQPVPSEKKILALAAVSMARPLKKSVTKWQAKTPNPDHETMHHPKH